MKPFNPPKINTWDCLLTLGVLFATFAVAILGSLAFWGGLYFAITKLVEVTTR